MLILQKTIQSRPVCQPVLIFVERLMQKGCTIEKQELSDYHFDEMHFVLKAPENFILQKEELPAEITENKANYFTCNCHWSVVEPEDYLK